MGICWARSSALALFSSLILLSAPAWAAGQLMLESNPPGAVVTLNGQTLGETPLLHEGLHAGTHLVTLTRPGYKPVTLRVTVEHDLTTRQRVTMTPERRTPTGDLVVESAPAGADVYLEGRWIGKTPLHVPVAAGSRRLSLRLAGYETLARTVRVVPDLTTTQRVSLVAIAPEPPPVMAQAPTPATPAPQPPVPLAPTPEVQADARSAPPEAAPLKSVPPSPEPAAPEAATPEAGTAEPNAEPVSRPLARLFGHPHAVIPPSPTRHSPQPHEAGRHAPPELHPEPRPEPRPRPTRKPRVAKASPSPSVAPSPAVQGPPLPRPAFVLPRLALPPLSWPEWQLPSVDWPRPRIPQLPELPTFPADTLEALVERARHAGFSLMMLGFVATLGRVLWRQRAKPLDWQPDLPAAGFHLLPDSGDAVENLAARATLSAVQRAELGYWDQAFADLREAHRRVPSAETAYNLGVGWDLSGAPDWAELAYRTALQLDPQHRDAGMNLAILLANQEKPLEAWLVYRMLAEAHPEDGAIAFNRGNHLAALGQLAAALSELKRARRLMPLDPGPQANLRIVRRRKRTAMVARALRRTPWAR